MSDFDINKIATDLNGKADMDLTNTIGALSTSSKNYFSGLGMPSGRYVNLTLGATGTQYTAPANGYFSVAKTASASGQYLNMYSVADDNKSVAGYGLNASTSNQTTRLMIPCAKGNKIMVSYSMAGSSQYDFFRFIYAQGESEE